MSLFSFINPFKSQTRSYPCFFTKRTQNGTVIIIQVAQDIPVALVVHTTDSDFAINEPIKVSSDPVEAGWSIMSKKQVLRTANPETVANVISEFIKTLKDFKEYAFGLEEEIENQEPLDWSNPEQIKYTLAFDYAKNKYILVEHTTTKFMETPYTSSKKLAQKGIDILNSKHKQKSNTLH